MSYQTISASEFADRIAQGKVPFCVDVRTGAEFAGERCRQSINVPLQNLTADPLEFLIQEHGVSEGEAVYLICQAGKRSEMAAAKVAGQLSRSVCVVAGGVEALPVNVKEQGAGKVISLERQVRIAAGFLVLLGVIIGFAVAPWGFVISGCVGAGVMFAGITDTCAMGMLLARMPWNKVS